MMQGKDIFLRAIELEDIDTLYDMENDMGNWKISDTQMPFSRYTMEQYVINCSTQDIYTLKQLRLMICLCSSRESIGCIDLFDFNPANRRAAVGILVRKEFRQKGYASEALELLLHYATDVLQLKQLYCHIDASNTPSLRLFEKHGFQRGGCFKAWEQRSGTEWEDTYLLQHIFY